MRPVWGCACPSCAADEMGSSGVSSNEVSPDPEERRLAKPSWVPDPQKLRAGTCVPYSLYIWGHFSVASLCGFSRLEGGFPNPGQEHSVGQRSLSCWQGIEGTIGVGEQHGMGWSWILTWSVSLLVMSVQGQSCQGSALEGGNLRLGPQKPSVPAGHTRSCSGVSRLPHPPPPPHPISPCSSPSAAAHDGKWNYIFITPCFPTDCVPCALG